MKRRGKTGFKLVQPSTTPKTSTLMTQIRVYPDINKTSDPVATSI